MDPTRELFGRITEGLHGQLLVNMGQGNNSIHQQTRLVLRQVLMGNLQIKTVFINMNESTTNTAIAFTICQIFRGGSELGIKYHVYVQDVVTFIKQTQKYEQIILGNV